LKQFERGVHFLLHFENKKCRWRHYFTDRIGLIIYILQSGK